MGPDLAGENSMGSSVKASRGAVGTHAVDQGGRQAVTEPGTVASTVDGVKGTRGPLAKGVAI